MESTPLPPNPDDPRSVLAVADLAGQRLAAGLRLPTGLHPALATAIAIQLGTAAFGIANQDIVGLVVAMVGVAVFLGMAAFMLYRFRRINGVRVDGLSSQIVLGSGATPTLAYLGAFGIATWAAFDSRWWLVAPAAVVGGIGYAYGVQLWWRRYRRAPAAHAGGTTPRMLVVLAVFASLGLVALLIAS